MITIKKAIMLSLLLANRGTSALIRRSTLSRLTHLNGIGPASKGSAEWLINKSTHHACATPSIWFRSKLLVRFMSTDGDTDDADSEDEEQPPEIVHLARLEALKFKDYDVMYLRDLEERGELELQPFYQRGYKWSQKQASLWIESILRGYPCLPEIALLSAVDEEGNEKYAVFDGQQRLTSIMLYMKNDRSKTWPIRKGDDSFRLENLTIMKEYEGKTFKDLPIRQQNEIRKFDVRCAIIPVSWTVSDYIDFFKRIQGGGTPMTVNELCRIISQGPFTDLLDKLAKDELVTRALDGFKGLKVDDVHRLLLRYFQFRADSSRFGKPSLDQNGLETMKRLNREMKSWTGDEFYKQEHHVGPIKKSLELIMHIFHQNEAFRRPVPLVKKGIVLHDDSVNKVWFDQSKIREQIWVCTVATFARENILKQEKDVRRHAGAIRNELITIMQTEPSFTDTLRSSEVSTRVHLFETAILSILKSSAKSEPRKICNQQRNELIQAARENGLPCKMCGQPLSPYDDHLHIDHIHPLSKGGTNELKNLQVMHKTCNLMKSNKIAETDA